MHKSVERSIALWKAQHGPIRNNIGCHVKDSLKQWTPFDIRPEHRFFIDYTSRDCAWS